MTTAYDPVPADADPSADDPAADGPSSADRTAAGMRRVSVVHLVAGLVFLGLAGLWALAASGVVGSDDTWLLPGVLVVAGATGLLAALVAGRASGDR